MPPAGRNAVESCRGNHKRRRSLDASSHGAWTDSLFRRRFILHASILKHVRPLPTGPSMAVLEVLTKVVSTVELLRLVALAKFVDMIKVLGSKIPLRRIGELFTAVPAVVCAAGVRRGVESSFRAS